MAIIIIMWDKVCETPRTPPGIYKVLNKWYLQVDKGSDEDGEDADVWWPWLQRLFIVQCVMVFLALEL